MATAKKGSPAAELSPSGLPIKSIPGSYGVPFFSAIRERLDFYYFQGHFDYFKSRVDKLGSTVVRINVPPGPFLAGNPHVIALLDAVSFRVLLDSSKVEKTNTFTGTYVPSLSLYSGIRPLSFLDTTDPLHSPLKTLLFRLLAARKTQFVPSFHEAYSSVFDKIESTLASSGPVEFNALNDPAAFDFTCGAFFGDLPSVVVGPTAYSMAVKWLFFQLHPLVSKVSDLLPWPIEDLLFHYFRLPPCLVHSDYKKLETYYAKAGKSVLDEAEQLGIARRVALHNIIFATSFNAYGGIKALLPFILKWLSQAGPELHEKLAQEVRSVVQSDNGVITPAGLERMPLTKSVVWEVLRLNPPAEYQYGKARMDMIIESHDSAFRVKKGEMLFGYQPVVTRDDKVFVNGDHFLPDRYVTDEGKKLLNYVYWSNGPETQEPAVSNKQCAGKGMVVMVGRIFVAELFLRYDTFTAEVGTLPLEPKITFTSVTRSQDI